jgi:hypothetical protein
VTAAEVPGSAGILISLDALILQRAEQPDALEEAPVSLRRIGWMGRPIVLVGERVAGRELPSAGKDREAWVRATVGPGAYSVVGFEQPVQERGTHDRDEKAVEQWRSVAEATQGIWLVTERSGQVGPAHQAGLKVILIGPSDGQPWLQRPDYQARDLRDAVGHLLAADVFANPIPRPAPSQLERTRTRRS